MIKKITVALAITFISACSINSAPELNDITSVNNKVSAFNSSKSVDSYFNDLINQKKSVGLAIALIRNNKVDFYNYGYTAKNSKVAPNENSIFHIASISKAFTGVLLGEMVSKGEVALDNTLVSLLPKGTVVPSFKNQPITLSDLATHIAGFPTSPSDLEKVNFDPMNPYAHYNTQNVYNFLKTYQLTQDDVNKTGYGYYEYSNLGFGLLGHSLGLKSKSNYTENLKNKVINPLALKNTSIASDITKNKSLVTGHYNQNGELIEMPMSNFTDILSGGAALKSTSKDLAKFVQANMGVIETPLRKAMDLSHKEVYPGQGLGWLVYNAENGKEVIWHNGAWYASGFTGFIGFDKKNKNGIVILSNTVNYFENIANDGIAMVMSM